jgi:hypothetical protein
MIFDPEDRDAFSACMEKMLQPAVRERMAGPSREMGESHSAHARGRALWHWLHDDILHAQRSAAPQPSPIRA